MWRSLVVSGGLFAAEVLVLSLLADHNTAQHTVVIGVPILQTISSVVVEARTDDR
jgi:hypothetical protein